MTSRSSMNLNEAFGSMKRLMSQAEAILSTKGLFLVAQVRAW